MAKSPLIGWLVQLLLAILTTALTSLSDSSLLALPDPGSDFDIKTGSLLSPLLRPRVPGTEGSTAAQNHFADFFKTNLPQWKVSFQNSSQKIPVMDNKEYPFSNFIATRDPPWSRPGEVGYLTLVAHYDSLWHPEGFIGAIDSAAPCAMIMHAARSLDAMMTRKWDAMTKIGVEEEGYDDGGIEGHKGIQILFLDGEEAFGAWSATDSVYGARSLAKEMEETLHPAMSTYHNALSSISLFVLLDLLGSKDPNVPSFFKTTHWAYQRMAGLEKRLRDKGMFKSKGEWFRDKEKDDHGLWMGGKIEDDHIPFMARGVDVLHVIPAPFPDQWHKSWDDGEHLDMDTCADWAVLTTAFVAEWMDLEGFVEEKAAKQKKRAGEDRKKVTSKTEL